MTHSKKNGKPLYIVGIGASAEGLADLERFFDNTPVDGGMAFVVIQHPFAEFKSPMDELLKQHTRMSVQFIADGGTLEPDNVYLIPPMSQVTLSDGRFTLYKGVAGEQPYRPIDRFLGSLAQASAACGVGVVLPGTGKDGSRGLRAIHAAGGLVILQSPGSAQCHGVPQSVIDAGLGDIVLSADQIYATIMRHRANQEELQPLSHRQSYLGTGDLGCELETVNSVHKPFRKIGVRKLPLQPRLDGAVYERAAGFAKPQLVSLERQVLHDYDVLLDRHLPAGVLINEERRIVHYFGDVAQYLKMPKGRVTADLLLFCDDNLQLALSISLRESGKSGKSVVTRDIRIARGENESMVDLTVDPIPDVSCGSVHYHVYFDRVRPVELPLPLRRRSASKVLSFDADLYGRQQIRDLEAELQLLREKLLACHEEQQAAMEESQVTNEELRVTNEELRASNEELQVSLDELSTVNLEFERKNLEFKRLDVEHDNMLSSIDSGMIFLDRQMCIRRFNPAIASFFTLLPRDIGRPLDDIASHIADRRQVQSDIRRVLVDAVCVEKEIVAGDGKWLLIRIMPFRTETGQMDGVIITFTDVSTIKGTEQTVKRLNWELQKANEGLEMRVVARTGELERSRAELEAQNAELKLAYQVVKTESAGRVSAVEELRKKEMLLIQQSRMAAMGEMLANIAHQWRQPLNMLGLKIQEIGLSFELGGFTKELLDTNIEKAMEILFHLSQTIDDFRDFSVADLEKSLFPLERVVAKTVSFIADNFRQMGIGIETELGCELQIYGFPNEYGQVLLNLLMNAMDAFALRPTDDALIIIRAQAEEGRVVLTLADNAGGIREEIMEKIFDPYFTTKEPGKGTGIGLFMSKNIIEKGMGGHLSAHNVDGGAEFRVEV